MKPAITSKFVPARRSAPSRKLARLLLLATLSVGSAASIAAGPDDPSTQTATATATATSAKWAARKLNFTYSGFTAHYSCDGLRDQVKAILRQLGAREDLSIKSRGCTRFTGPEVFPGVEATFSVLELAADDGRGAGKPQDVAARWEPVTLDSDTPSRTNSGQCELIEQVKKSVLPLFTTRNLTYSSDCFPHAESLAGTRLSVEVLRPIKPPAPQSTPP